MLITKTFSDYVPADVALDDYKKALAKLDKAINDYYNGKVDNAELPSQGVEVNVDTKVELNGYNAMIVKTLTIYIPR